MVQGQIKTIRYRRAVGSYYPALVSDLRLYLTERRRWRRLAADLQRAVDAQLAAPTAGAAEAA
jgi:hypothetical protein